MITRSYYLCYGCSEQACKCLIEKIHATGFLAHLLPEFTNVTHGSAMAQTEDCDNLRPGRFKQRPRRQRAVEEEGGGGGTVPLQYFRILKS